MFAEVSDGVARVCRSFPAGNREERWEERGWMPELIVGPMLRYLGEREATVWVETDEACEVEILDRSARTFEVHGHHYAIVALDALEPGTTYEYEVAIDGEVRWPDPDDD